MFPNDRVTLCGRASVLRDMGRSSEALNAIKAVMHILGPDSITRCTMAGVLRDQNKLEEAKKIFQDLRADEPLNLYAALGLATTYKMQGAFGEALAEFTQVVDQFRRIPQGMLGRAGVWRMTGRPEEAQCEYEGVLRRFRKNAQARNGLAAILTSKAEYKAALELLPEYLPSSQSDWKLTT